MKKTVTVKPKPYEDEITICDWCGRVGGEFYTPYDLSGASQEYPYDRYLDLHDECKAKFVAEYGPQIWMVFDSIIDQIKSKTPNQN